MHELPVIATLAGALAFALIFGWITQRFGLSTLVGYMLAGIMVGPYTPGFVADTDLASQMAEIGVILLMFGVGLHFHPQELLRVWRIAVPGAVVQSAVAALAGWASARMFGWSDAAGIIFGMALAVASTVVLMRMLVEQDRLGGRDGHVAVGWLIVEDLFTVVALVLLPTLVAEKTSVLETARAVVATFGKGAIFAALIWLLGTRLVSPVMERVARARSAELFTVAVFVLALGVAVVAAKVFHMSVALGAFFAGLVVGQSRFGPQAAADMAPFRDVFSALFFVSVGMLFNPKFVVAHPEMVVTVLIIVLVVKPLVAVAIVMLLRDTKRTALTVAIGLAQIGEFSFILGTLGNALNVLPREAMDALVVAAIISIALNPLLFRGLRRLEARYAWETLEQQNGAASATADEHRESHYLVAIAGMEELGRRLVQRCVESGVSLCAIHNDVEVLDELHSRGIATVYGDPGRQDVLSAAGLAKAKMIVVTAASLQEKIRICIAAREVNSRIAIVASAATSAERMWLQEFGVAHIFDALDEITEGLLRAIRSGL